MIVNTSTEAEKVIHDVLTLVDRQLVSPETFGYVLVSEQIGAPATIRDRDEEEKAIQQASIDLSMYLNPQPKRDKQLAAKVHAIATEIEATAGESEVGELGGCWLWLVDNAHDITRALVNEEDICVNESGKYLMFPHEFSDDRSLRQRETMTKELARRLTKEFGVQAGYFSVLCSGNPDGMPSFYSDFLDNRLHFNFWSDGLK